MITIDPWLALAAVAVVVVCGIAQIWVASQHARINRHLTDLRIELDERDRLVRKREESLAVRMREFDEAVAPRKTGRR